MTSPQEFASAILAGVGGPSNIASVEHCTTRLRFVLADPRAAHRELVDSLPGVLSVVERGGQFQVVIGNQVPEVYAALVADPRVAQDAATGPRRNLLDRLFDLLVGTFQPLMMPMVGAAMIKTALSLAVQLGWLSKDSTTYAIWAAAGNAVFFYLPVLVGFTSARKLGANPYLGAVLGAALLEPNFTELGPPGTTARFLGIPLVVADYSQSVFPTIMAVALLGVMERWLRARVPKDLRLAVIPGLCLAVLVPATFLVFGPIGQYLGQAIADGIAALNQSNPVLTGALFAAAFMFLVMFGLHWALVPVMLSGIADNGSEPLVAYMGAYNFAVFGIALGVFLRTRSDPGLRQLTGSGVLSGLLAGISEPIVYGVLLRFKKTLAIMVFSAAVSGAIMGAAGVQGTVLVFNSVFTIPTFTPTAAYLFAIMTGFLLGLTLVLLLGYQTRWQYQQAAEEQQLAADQPPVGAAREAMPVVALNEPDPAGPGSDGPADPVRPVGHAGHLHLATPFAGSVLALREVTDPVFARELLGPGAAVRPDPDTIELVVRAPVSGRVTSISRTAHAVGLTTSDGVDVLVHVGLDTVALAGTHFVAHVGRNAEVQAGDPLLTCSATEIRAAGFDLTTPVVVANAAAFGPVLVTTAGMVADGDLLAVVTGLA